MNIIKLFKTEYLKFKNNTTVLLLFILFSITMPLVILLGKSFSGAQLGPLPSVDELYEFPMVWEYQGYVGNWLVFFFLGFMVLHMYTSEVSYKTMRQNIITGYTKKEYYTSKVVTILALAFYATVLYTISVLLLGIFNTEDYDMELLMDCNFAPLRFFLMSLGYLAFAFLVAAVFRRGGLSIFFYFSYGLILESILRYSYLYFTEHVSANFFPLNAIEDNMTFPLMRTSNEFLKSEHDFSLINSFQTAGGLSIFYILLFFALAWLKIKKSDV